MRLFLMRNFCHFSIYIQTEKKLNLKNPKTYNEKIQWLKVNDHNPEYTRIVDKYLFKEYIEERIGPGYTIPLLGYDIVWMKLTLTLTVYRIDLY